MLAATLNILSDVIVVECLRHTCAWPDFEIENIGVLRKLEDAAEIDFAKTSRNVRRLHF